LPEPWQTTDSAMVLLMRNSGDIAWVPFNIGGYPFQYSAQPSILMSWIWEPRTNWIFPNWPLSASFNPYRNSRVYSAVSIIIYTLPTRRLASTIALQSSTVIAMGMVQAVCLLAFNEA